MLLKLRRRYRHQRHRCHLYAAQRWKILATTKGWNGGFNVIQTAIHVMQDIGYFQMVDAVILPVVSVLMAAMPAMCTIHAFVWTTPPPLRPCHPRNHPPIDPHPVWFMDIHITMMGSVVEQ